MHRQCKRVPRGHLAVPAIIAFCFVALVAARATAEKSKTNDNITLTVMAFERMQQYPPPPPPPQVFVVSAGAGQEMAVITLTVQGSTSFEDYKMSAGAFLVDAGGTRHSAVLSKPSKGAGQADVWARHVLVFSIAKDAKLKSLSVGDMTFDLSKLEETK